MEQIMSEQRTVEIRAGEGGLDARIFAAELAASYLRLAERRHWKATAEPSPDFRAGCQMITLTFDGKGVEGLGAEAGGHRVQRVPGSERNGRVHSSTVTVAVLGAGRLQRRSPYLARDASDFLKSWYSGSGAGGQHRNKTMNSVRLTHVPTGLVRTAQTRSRENSLQLAMTAITTELDRMAAADGLTAVNEVRRGQVGSGERSDRRRTWAFQRDSVDDHITGRSIRCADAFRGQLDRLW
jgi:peptide chain release factor 1